MNVAPIFALRRLILIEEGWVTLFATNGAGISHDWEFSFHGMSSDDVRANVGKGKLGIICTHPANHGAAIGRTALRDFLTFAAQVRELEKQA